MTDINEAAGLAGFLRLHVFFEAHLAFFVLPCRQQPPFTSPVCSNGVRGEYKRTESLRHVCATRSAASAAAAAAGPRFVCENANADKCVSKCLSARAPACVVTSARAGACVRCALCVCVCLCVRERDRDTAGGRMALASGQWLEKEMRGDAPCPRFVTLFLCRNKAFDNLRLH